MRFYSIKNRFVDSYNTPFPCENDKMAVYTVRQIVNEQKEPRIIPSDFSLYFVGEYDPILGLFVALEFPVPLVEDCSILVVKEGEYE